MQRESQPLNTRNTNWAWRLREARREERRKRGKAGASSLYATNGVWLMTRETNLRRVQGGADRRTVLLDACASDCVTVNRCARFLFQSK